MRISSEDLNILSALSSAGFIDTDTTIDIIVTKNGSSGITITKDDRELIRKGVPEIQERRIA